MSIDDFINETLHSLFPDEDLLEEENLGTLGNCKQCPNTRHNPASCRTHPECPLSAISELYKERTTPGRGWISAFNPEEVSE